MDAEHINNLIIQQDNDSSFQQMIEDSPLGVIILGSDSIRYSNEKFARIVGASCKRAITGKSIVEYIHPSYQNFFFEWMQKIPSNLSRPNHIEMILLKNNNDVINVEICGGNIRQNENSLVQLYINDITEKKRVETDLKYMTNASSLSDHINDTLLHRYINDAIKSAAIKKCYMAIMYLNLDHFKLIHETYGHKIGDLLLQAITQRLKKYCRRSDLILPLGGDKFVVIMNDMENAGIVNEMIQHFNNRLSDSFHIENNDIYTTVTAGISIFPENGVDCETILKNAVLAHYYAKKQGQNNYRFYNLSMSKHIKEKTELLYDLRQAIKNDEFCLLYQPIVNTHSGKIIALEALLRWHRLKKTMMIPGEFLSVAEESGLIFEIGQWVINKVCNQTYLWQQSGLSPVPVSINLSSSQFNAKSDIIKFVQAALLENKLSPNLIEFEMSENVTVLDIGSDILHELKNMGIRLSINNFGASYFSLNELKRHYIDTIKIDRSLINCVPDDPDKSLIVSAIIAMGKKMGLHVIGEGIETSEQLAFLNANRCHTAQGNLLCQPLTSEELPDLLSGKKQLMKEMCEV